jgi:diguanylate cyclase (GGDEF)-like protein
MADDVSTASGAARPEAGGPDAAEILRKIGTVIYDWDLVSDKLSWSENVADVLDVGAADAIGTGRDYANLLAPQSLASRYTAIQNARGIDQGDGIAFEVVYGLVKPDRSLIWIEDIGRWFAGLDGQPRRAQGAVRVVTERHEEARRAADAAQVDRLTGAMSREALFECLNRIAAAPSEERSSIAVLLAAVDNLGVMNESYGYTIVDALVAGVVHRLRENLRATDIIARFTGNKFAIVLHACDAERMEAMAHRLVNVVAASPISTPAGSLQTSVRIGGVMDPRSARSPEIFMKHAEEALDQAGQHAARRFVIYTPTLARDGGRVRTLQVANEIVAALNSRRVFLVFQPIIDSASSIPAFYEALVRVQRLDGSIALPGTFLPIAEKVGLVQLIDQRVFELAVAQLSAEPSLTLAINVSLITALDFEWPKRVEQMLALHPGVAERLIIELTETRAIEDIEATVRVIAQLRSLKLRVAMDDFGAGHTSFKNLRKLGVDLLKIDGAFVRNLAQSRDDRFFVHTLCDLARHVNVPVVAEWVEDAASAEILKDWGVSYLQGHHFGKAAALPAEFHASPGAAVA